MITGEGIEDITKFVHKHIDVIDKESLGEYLG
jgi:hypothetical protein